jgi:hypothetical protein
MDEKQIKSKIADGYIHVRIILEIIGKPKEHVEESLKDYVKKIKADKELIIIKESSEKAEKHEGDLFSAFAELDMLMKGPEDLLAFCFDYMPSSVEIIEPEKIFIKNSDFSDFTNDMLSRSISLNTSYLEMQEKLNFYLANTAILLRNFIVVLLSSRPMTVKKMAPYLGIKESEVQQVVEVLVKEGKVKKDKDVYVAVPKKDE